MPVWLSAAAVGAIQDWLQAEHGAGGASRLNPTGVAAVLAAPRAQHVAGETDLFRLAARYSLGAARDRPFGGASDGAALVLAGVFLALNGWHLVASESDAASVTRALASRELDASAYAMWLEGASEPIAAHAS